MAWVENVQKHERLDMAGLLMDGVVEFKPLGAFIRADGLARMLTPCPVCGGTRKKVLDCGEVYSVACSVCLPPNEGSMGFVVGEIDVAKRVFRPVSIERAA